tara:strand:- start:1458 stop:1826 length:369 start_codon:yes stop_codon:yes gene_type:complete
MGFDIILRDLSNGELQICHEAYLSYNFSYLYDYFYIKDINNKNSYNVNILLENGINKLIKNNNIIERQTIEILDDYGNIKDFYKKKLKNINLKREIKILYLKKLLELKDLTIQYPCALWVIL